jgi:undecaprenyl-diphosphatase
MSARARAAGVDWAAAEVALLLLLAAVLLSVLAHLYPVFPGDATVTRWISDLGATIGWCLQAVNERHQSVAVTLTTVAVVIAVARGRLDVALIAILLGLAADHTDLIKALVDRPRPGAALPTREIVSESSFPSGHVTTVVLAAGTWFLFAPVLVGSRYTRLIRLIAVVGVGLVAIARMWAGVHWLSDTYGAVLWGSALLAAVAAIQPVLEAAARGSRNGDDGQPPGRTFRVPQPKRSFLRSIHGIRGALPVQ